LAPALVASGPEPVSSFGVAPIRPTPNGRTTIRVTTVARRYDTVTFLSDFGLDDEFAGVVKAVVRDLAPHVTVVDLTHGIRPFDIRGGALALVRAIPYVPDGIVLAVVDPGVGTARRAVAIEVADGAGVAIGPDNGLLAPAVAVAGGGTRAVELTNEQYQLAAPGATFAGRDVFAPAAAHLCNGVDLAELGTAVDLAELTPGMIPLPRPEGGGIRAEVLWVDRYGNCQLNIGPDDLDDVDGASNVWAVTVDDERRAARTARSFGELGAGAVGLVLDSYGLYELALDQRSAAGELGLAVGDGVVITPFDEAERPAVTTAVGLQPRR
jgi:S-adenosyl-L-methionine hydrolase (adenosine-forming)